MQKENVIQEVVDADALSPEKGNNCQEYFGEYSGGGVQPEG